MRNLIAIGIKTDRCTQEKLQRTEETHARSKALYEKEVRRSRKEAFTSSSTLVKKQQELISATNKFTLMREEVDAQRRKVEEKEEETFSVRYQLAALQEEIETSRRQRKATEEERDALKTSLKEEEVARIAAEGRIALPISREGDEFASPKKKKNRSARKESLKENVDPEFSAEQEELTVLKGEMRWEKRLRQRAEDLVDFMKMECQFQCCSCRVAERQGVDFVHDEAWAKQVVRKASVPYRPLPLDQSSEVFTDLDAASSRQPSLQLEDSEPLIKFSPSTGTFYKTPSPPKQTTSTQFLISPQKPADRDTVSPPPPPPHRPSTPPFQQEKSSVPSTHHLPTISTPFHRPLPIPPFGSKITPKHIIKTTTTTVPLIGTPVPLAHIPFSPDSTMTREQALEQIRVRRGRARSVAPGQGTPRRPMVVGVERRDVSAPAGRIE